MNNFINHKPLILLLLTLATSQEITPGGKDKKGAASAQTETVQSKEAEAIQNLQKRLGELNAKLKQGQQQLTTAIEAKELAQNVADQEYRRAQNAEQKLLELQQEYQHAGETTKETMQNLLQQVGQLTADNEQGSEAYHRLRQQHEALKLQNQEQSEKAEFAYRELFSKNQALLTQLQTTTMRADQAETTNQQLLEQKAQDNPDAKELKKLLSAKTQQAKQFEQHRQEMLAQLEQQQLKLTEKLLIFNSKPIEVDGLGDSDNESETEYPLTATVPEQNKPWHSPLDCTLGHLTSSEKSEVTACHTYLDTLVEAQQLEEYVTKGNRQEEGRVTRRLTTGTHENNQQQQIALKINRKTRSQLRKQQSLSLHQQLAKTLRALIAINKTPGAPSKIASDHAQALLESVQKQRNENSYDARCAIRDSYKRNKALTQQEEELLKILHPNTILKDEINPQEFALQALATKRKLLSHPPSPTTVSQHNLLTDQPHKD